MYGCGATYVTIILLVMFGTSKIGAYVYVIGSVNKRQRVLLTIALIESQSTDHFHCIINALIFIIYNTLAISNNRKEAKWISRI